MKFQFALLTVAACVTLGATTGIPILSTYVEAYKHCSSASNNTYVSVKYANTTDLVNYEYGQCYPYQIDGNLAQQAVFCKSVTCYSNPNPDCTGGAVPPVPVPVPAGLTLVNAADFVQLLGQGATCQPNKLPI